MANLGFIGIGVMGEPMAGHLLAAGHTVRIYDVAAARMEGLAANGAAACANGREAAQGAEIVFVIVPHAADVEAALFGRDGAAEGLLSGAVVVDMSTIPPSAARDIAGRLERIGVAMLDAPVSGGQAGAAAGTLSIMAGGGERHFRNVKPYFELMGGNINLVGELGHGQMAKGANQIMVTMAIEAFAEAMRFASAAGADPEKVCGALLGGLAESNVLKLHRERMVRELDAAGFRSANFRKDLKNILAVAGELEISLPYTSLTQTFYE